MEDFLLSNFLAISGRERFCPSPLSACLDVDTPAKYLLAVLIASLGMGWLSSPLEEKQHSFNF